MKPSKKNQINVLKPLVKKYNTDGQPMPLTHLCRKLDSKLNISDIQKTVQYLIGIELLEATDFAQRKTKTVEHKYYEGGNLNIGPNPDGVMYCERIIKNYPRKVWEHLISESRVANLIAALIGILGTLLYQLITSSK